MSVSCELCETIPPAVAFTTVLRVATIPVDWLAAST